MKVKKFFESLGKALVALLISPLSIIALPCTAFNETFNSEDNPKEFYYLDAKNTKREVIKVKYDRKHQKIELSEIQKSKIIELFKQLFDDNEEQELNVGVHLTRVELNNNEQINYGE